MKRIIVKGAPGSLIQEKCLNWIEEQYNILNHSNKEYINSYLVKTGSAKLFYDK